MVRFTLPRAIGATLASATLIAGVTLPAQAATVSDPIAEGLVTPLGLAVGSDGTFYVAEAFIGQITTIGKTGTRSSFTVDGSTAGVDAKGKGTLVYTVTGFPETEEEPADTFLYRTNPSGKARLLASPSAYEEAVNPDAGNTYGFVDLSPECAEQLPEFVPQEPYQGIIESNPYAVAIVPGGWLVADAAGNSVIRVGANRRISTVAVLPPISQEITQDVADAFGVPACGGHTYLGEPVPTDVEVGPDGHYYVSSLPGFPEMPGAGSVWRIDSSTGALTQVATGFTGAVDIAVAHDGTIYVAELFAGQISAIAPDGSTSVVVEVDEPTALEIGPDGTLYATLGLEGPGVLVSITPG